MPSRGGFAMDGREAFAVTLISVGLVLSVVILAVGALRDNWSLAWIFVALVAWLLIEPGWHLWLARDRTEDRKSPEKGS
jgi:hypothetical protein